MKIKKIKPGYFLFFILILGAVIRLLFLSTPQMDSDQAVTGLMARHILGGEFPFFFYAQDYCGSIEAYLVSTIFYFFAASRFTLDLTICLESLFFILFIYYLARFIFDKETALLSSLYTALASNYLIFHSVLARAAYIETPIIGVLLFIFSQKILYRDETQGRNFLFLGFLCGLGIWTHFLVVFYLTPIFLLFFIKDKWFWGRWTTLFFLLGLMLGGLPLWVHNINHPLVTWHYLFDTSGGDESFLTSLKDFSLYRFPEILGLKNNDTEKYYIPYFSFLLYIIYLISFLFLLLSRRKNFLSLIKLKIGQSSGLDLLLLFLFLFPVIFSLSGFASNHTSRYLQPLFSVLPILLAVFARRLYSFSTVSAFLLVLLTLFSNIYGTVTTVPLINKIQVNQFREARKNEQELFKFLKERNIRRVYCPDYWVSVRLTFDSREEIIFAQPGDDRYPAYTDWIDRDPKAAFLFARDNKNFENTLINIGGTYQKSQVFGYSIYHNFSPPPFLFIELEPTKWKAVTNSNLEGTINIFDRDLNTRWSSNKPQEPGLFLQIDLGQIVPDLGRITLLSGKQEDTPRGLQVEISQDGRKWQTVREVHGIWEDLFWSGPHPFYRPGIGRVDITFSPQPGRFLRLTQLGSDPTYYWSVAECFIYQAKHKAEPASDDVKPLISYLKRFNPVNIFTSPWIQSQLPLDWRAKQRTLALQDGKGDLVQILSNPAFVVEKEKASSLIHFLKKILKRPFQENEIEGYWISSIPSTTEHYQLISSKPWRFQTNVNPLKAQLAADGKMSTRWTTGRPQVPGDYFQIDFGKMEKVGRIRLLTGNSVNDFPRNLSIRYSTDGQVWTLLDPIMSPVLLHWTGETLLKNSQDMDFIFSPTPMRYLQIVNKGRDDIYYWSIHEVELYQRQHTE